MKKMLLLCGAMMLVSAVAAFAATGSTGLGLNWDNCTGPDVKISACTSNTASSQTLVLSYTPAADKGGFLGVVVDVNIAVDGTLPAWWSGTCAGKTLAQTYSSSGAIGSGNALCASGDDGYGGVNPTGGFAIARLGVPTAGSSVQLEAAWANSIDSPVDMVADTRYFIATFGINGSKSLGTGCPGCLTSACINFKKCILDATSQTPLSLILNPIDGPWVSYQGNPATPSSCLGATPTHNSTWGSVKALYR